MWLSQGNCGKVFRISAGDLAGPSPCTCIAADISNQGQPPVKQREESMDEQRQSCRANPDTTTFEPTTCP